MSQMQSATDNSALQELADALAVNYAIQIDEVGSISYVGKAVIGSLTSDPVWQIKKIDESGSPEVIIQWADGNDSFDNIFDNCATTIVYS